MSRVSAREHDPVEGHQDNGTSRRDAEVCVLLVEGRAGTASVVRTLLGASAAARFDVLRTATIEAGLEAIRCGGIDVVVLGTEALADDPSLEGLLDGAGGVPVIALTSSDDPRLATTLIDAGLHDCVPAARISADALGWAVLRAVHRHRRSRPGRSEPATAPASAPSVDAPSRIASTIAADVQTPVSALVGLIELLSSAWDTMADSQRRATLARISTYAASVEQLTADLLVIASLQVEVSSPAPQLVRVSAAVREAVTAATVDAVVEIDPDLVVWVDPSHLGQVLHALLAHATQRAPSPLTVTAGERGSSVRISIGGFNGSTRPDRVRSVHEVAAGAGNHDDGVGLAVARALAEANGGLAGVDDSAHGAVWARFPRAAPDHLPV